MKAHPTACAGALAVQKVIARDNLISNVRSMGAKLESLLKDQLAALPLVGDIRGRGLFWAVEFIRDKRTRIPFPLEDDFSKKVVEEGLKQGVNVLQNMGFPGTWKCDSVIVCPPFIVTGEQLVTIVALLKRAVEVVSQPYL